MKSSLLYKPSINLSGEMRKKIVEKEEKKDKADKKKEVVEIDDTVVEEDKRPDVDEEKLDRKRKREAAAIGVDPFDDGATLHFLAGASIIQEPKTYVKELKKIVLKEDMSYIKQMKMSQIQERTIIHLAEAIQAIIICNDFYTVETNMAKAAEKKNEKMKVEHGEKVKNLEERIKALKKKADKYDDLYSSKLSLEVLLAAVQKENEGIKAEKNDLKEERDKLEENIKDTQILGALGMEKHLMKEFLKHSGAEWEPGTKIKEISKYMKEKGIKSSDDEREDEGGDEGKGDEGEEKMDGEVSPPAADVGGD